VTLTGDTHFLRPGMSMQLSLTLSNTGLGTLRDAILAIQDTHGWVVPVTVEGLSLARQSSTNLFLSIQTTETVEDGETSIQFAVTSPSLARALVFSRAVPTRGYMPPLLAFTPTLYKRLTQVVSTNETPSENGEILSMVTTNTIVTTYPMIELVNHGERIASNLTVEIRLPTETNVFIYTYAVPALAPQEKRHLAIPLERRLLPESVLSLTITNETTRYLTTNIPMTLWPGE